MMADRICPFNYGIEQLQETAWQLSRTIIEMTTRAGSGHPSSSLSAIDLMTALYFGGMMCYYPEQPDHPARDRFILSKGHGAPALYAVLAKAGFFEADKLSELRTLGSPLEGHPNMRVLPGVEASTGSLGQGLSIAVGHALASKIDGRHYRAYVMIGDGECDEGQIWEGAMLAAKHRLDNLTAILDYNKFQQTGAVQEVMPSLEPLVDKWQAFGWDVREINGHAMPQILDAFQAASQVTGQPQMIVAHTLKGRGLSPFAKDGVNRRHGEALTPDEAKIALQELEQHKYDDQYLQPEYSAPLTPEDKYGEL